MSIHNPLHWLRPSFLVLSLVAASVACGGCGGGAGRPRNVPAARKAMPSKFPVTKTRWQGIDRVEFVERFNLNDYQRVVVLPLETAGTPLPDADDDTRPIVQAFLPNATGAFTQGLARSVTAVPVAVGPAPKAPRTATTAKPGAGQVSIVRTTSMSTGKPAAPKAQPGQTTAAAPKAAPKAAPGAAPKPAPAPVAPAERVLLVRARVFKMNPSSEFVRRTFAQFNAAAVGAGIEGEVVDAATGKTLLRFRDTRDSERYERGDSYDLLKSATRELGADVGVAIAVFAQAPQGGR